MGIALVTAFNKEFETLFKEVHIVENLSPKDKYQIYAFVDTKWQLISANTLSGEQVYAYSLAITFKDEELKRLIAQYEDVQTVHYSPPASAMAASAVTGASLFLLAPVTIPLTTVAIGGEAKEVLETTIAKSVRTLGDQVAADGQLRDYVPYLLANPGHGVKAAGRQSTELRLPSKYDHFLDGVVVVEAMNGFGSEFVASRNGYVITNEHVVGSDKFVRIKFRSGTVVHGTVVDADSSKDLALVEISGDNFSPLDLSTSADVIVDNDVLAIGIPKGLSWSISKGIVSAVRDLDDIRLIQTDAAINTGNSGGPLIDLQSGRVIGVNTLIYRKDLSEGLNFAVSAEAVWEAFGSRFSM